MADRKSWVGQGSRHERGYGSAWTKARERIIRRDKALCQECRRHGRVTSMQSVDHITPKAKGGTDDDANLECLCREHHDAKSAREAAEAQGRAIKARLAFDADGRPVWPDRG